MPSTREEFWGFGSYVVIGDTRGKRAFPKLTYQNLKKLGKTVYAVDPGQADLGGDTVYADVAALPAQPEAAVLEVPKDQTTAWVQKVADAGITNLWMHQQTDTPEALKLAQERGLRTEHGTCAVMYVRKGFSGHSIHRVIMKLSKQF
jgi:predicted CoA-binding protein